MAALTRVSLRRRRSCARMSWHSPRPSGRRSPRGKQTSLDDFVRLAIVEKIAAARTTQYVQTRAARADPQAFLAVLERLKQAAGPVVAGDEL